MEEHQKKLIERIVNARLDASGANLALEPNPLIWTNDILSETEDLPGELSVAGNLGTFIAGAPNATFGVPNAHWRTNAYAGRYVLDGAGHHRTPSRFSPIRRIN